MKKSIRKKINQLLATSLITLSFIMIGVNLIIVYKNTVRNSEIMISKTCSTQALELNNQFKQVEQSVQNLYEISEKFRPSLAELENIGTTRSYIEQFTDVALSIAENTDGAMAIYYRMNPEITGSGKTGFFYVKDPEKGKFQVMTVTDLGEYDPNDMEHVGWYYVPVWAGEPVWMEPYYNANVGVDMISYVMPIYDHSILVGVVGIDVDFNAILEIAENINIYESNGAVLCSLAENKIYYNKSTIWGDAIPEDIYGIMQGADSAAALIPYSMNGEKYSLYYQTLDNRMKLLIYAKSHEIFSQGYVTTGISLVVLAVVFAVTLLVSISTGKKITDPIGDITEATKKYAQGDWDAKVQCKTEDELQLLAENISVMAEKTKDYIKYINDMARRDVLTGLRNKTDYTLYIENINKEYIPAKRDFAVVVFDVNNLKKVNDTYGHEKGDELIVSASKCICRYFSHSPVFRIGGDEFISIIDGADWENRDEIVGEFRKHMRLAKNSEDIMDVCIACGMATIGADGASYDAIFEKADQRMYENKVELKNGELPR